MKLCPSQVYQSIASKHGLNDRPSLTQQVQNNGLSAQAYLFITTIIQYTFQTSCDNICVVAFFISFISLSVLKNIKNIYIHLDIIIIIVNKREVVNH